MPNALNDVSVRNILEVGKGIKHRVVVNKQWLQGVSIHKESTTPCHIQALVVLCCRFNLQFLAIDRIVSIL
jgi:hypothetical protein